MRHMIKVDFTRFSSNLFDSNRAVWADTRDGSEDQSQEGQLSQGLSEDHLRREVRNGRHLGLPSWLGERGVRRPS